MTGLKEFFGNLFTGSNGADVVRLNLTGAGPAERPTPAPASAELAASQEQAAPEAAYKKGDVIGGKYEVHGLLGRGGFGEVYLVYSLQLRDALALKTFRREFLANAEAKDNFKREALLWMKLEEHPFILAARFVDEFSGRLFVGMDYVAPDDRGRVTLADHLDRARVPFETDQILQWAIMFCHGMEHANQRGIRCHRDIKPANILIRQDATLLISDFGLAAGAEAAWRRCSSPLESARQGSFIGLSLFHSEGKRVCGTPGYLAPEVFRGEGADTRSDIYSFGLVLWQMVAGSQSPPFAVGVEPPRSPRDIDRYAIEIYQQQMKKRVPPTGEPLEAVIERCIAPEPSKRFSSFTQLRAELEPILYRRTGRTVKPSPVGERDLMFWNNKGFSLNSLGRYDEAAACFRKALEIQPGFAMAHLNLGLALKGKDDLDGAIAEFRTALRLQPNSPLAHANLGGALQQKGDLLGAIAELRTALHLQPDSANAHTNLGNTLHAKGDLDGAIAEFRAAISLQPDDADAHTNLASALADKGNLDGAIAEFRMALRLQPDYALAHANLGTVLADKGDLDGAIVEYRVALRFQPDNANAHNYLGTGLSAKGDMDGAIAEFRTAIRLQPGLADAHGNLAIALHRKGDLNGEIDELRTTIRLKPDLAMAHCALGAAIGTKGDLDGAITEFRTAISLQPDNADAQRNLAIALQKKGDRKAAINGVRAAQESAAPRSKESFRNSREEVAETAAMRVAEVFSSGRFTDLFKGQSMAEGWTLGDALAVWYSLGHFALVVAAWSAYNDRTQVFNFTDLCRPRLVKHWNVSPNVLDKLRTVVNETEGAAFASYARCNRSNDLSLFFSRYVSRILGAPVPFSEGDMFEDLLMGIKYRGSDPILCIAVCKLFVGICVEIKELLG